MANFHLILMLETTKYLGFYPDTSDMDMPFFEMTEGVLPFHAISSLSEHETNLFKN
jgi:DNA repair protein RecO (recombination protein O)